MFILQLSYLSSPYSPHEHRHAKCMHSQHTHYNHAHCHICLAVPHSIPINIKLAHIHLRSRGGGRENKTYKENSQGIPLMASSKGGAGIWLGPGIVSGVDAKSETLLSLLLGQQTTLRPENSEYVLLESSVGKKVRSRSKWLVIFAVDRHRHPMLGSVCGGVQCVPLHCCYGVSIYVHICQI